MKRIPHLIIVALFLVVSGFLAPATAHADSGEGEVHPTTYRAHAYQLSADGNTAYVTFWHGYCERDFAGRIERVRSRPTVKITGNVYGRFCVPSMHQTTLELDAHGLYLRYFGLYNTDGSRVPFQGYHTPQA